MVTLILPHCGLISYTMVVPFILFW